MKEILLYTSIYSYVAADFIKQMEDSKNAGVRMRISCNGGNVEEGFGMIAKWREYTGPKKIVVDGKAYSMAAYFLCYATEVECLDVSDFMIHRAAYSEWLESDMNFMTESVVNRLNTINDFLRKALESKIDVKKFEKITGVTLDELYDLSKRIDVSLTAQQALEVGLVNKINPITPEMKASISSKSLELAAHYNGSEKITHTNNILPITSNKPEPKNHSKSEKMTIQELKANHPELVKQLLAEGVNQEKARVKAWLAWNKVDAERVNKAIEEGEEFTTTAMSELSVKAVSITSKQNLAADSAKDVETPEAGGNPEASKNAQFEANVRKGLGLK